MSETKVTKKQNLSDIIDKINQIKTISKLYEEIMIRLLYTNIRTGTCDNGRPFNKKTFATMNAYGLSDGISHLAKKTYKEWSKLKFKEEELEFEESDDECSTSSDDELDNVVVDIEEKCEKKVLPQKIDQDTIYDNRNKVIECVRIGDLCLIHSDHYDNIHEKIIDLYKICFVL